MSYQATPEPKILKEFYQNCSFDISAIPVDDLIRVLNKMECRMLMKFRRLCHWSYNIVKEKAVHIGVPVNARLVIGPLAKKNKQPVNGGKIYLMIKVPTDEDEHIFKVELQAGEHSSLYGWSFGSVEIRPFSATTSEYPADFANSIRLFLQMRKWRGHEAHLCTNGPMEYFTIDKPIVMVANHLPTTIPTYTKQMYIDLAPKKLPFLAWENIRHLEYFQFNLNTFKRIVETTNSLLTVWERGRCGAVKIVEFVMVDQSGTANDLTQNRELLRIHKDLVRQTKLKNWNGTARTIRILKDSVPYGKRCRVHYQFMGDAFNMNIRLYVNHDGPIPMRFDNLYEAFSRMTEEETCSQ